MSSSMDDLTKDQLETAIYIYIGQNIRDEGILKHDTYLEKRASIVQILLDKEIVEQRRWYRFDVIRISYRSTVLIRKIMEDRLKSEKDGLSSAIKKIPKSLLSFFVFEYMSDDLSFPIEKDWIRYH